MSAQVSLLDRVRFVRAASAVERCHEKPHTKPYPVGHHTFDLLTLLTLCWQKAHDDALPRAELLVAGTAHDLPELVTGDVKSIIKNLLEGRLDGVEERVERWLGFRVELTDEEQAYLGAADRFELYLWCHDEARRGNPDFLHWAHEYQARWEDEPLPWPFMELLDEVTITALAPLGNAELMTIGGLNAVR